jgi:hypothetical protein
MRDGLTGLAAALWCAAGIVAGGIWFSVTEKDWLGATLFGAITFALGLVGMLIEGRRLNPNRSPFGPEDPRSLLDFIWAYPLAGEAEASWAVKEGETLQGNLGTARERPALGVAIVTTELALLAFGDSARAAHRPMYQLGGPPM